MKDKYILHYIIGHLQQGIQDEQLGIDTCKDKALLEIHKTRKDCLKGILNIILEKQKG